MTTYWNVQNIHEHLDPSIHLDWRWRRIIELLECRGRPTILDDDVVREGWKFGCDMAKTSDPVMRKFLAKGYPSINAAVTVRNKQGRSCNWLQAMTLCEDLEIEDEAYYMGMTKDAIRMYELLFFDIRAARDQKGYVAYMITTPDEIETLSNGKDSSLYWKLIAMYGGFEAIRPFWENRPGAARTTKYYRDTGDTISARNYCAAQFIRQVRPFNVEAICTEHLHLREIEDKRDQIRGAVSSRGNEFTDELVGVVLNEIECSVLNPMEKAVKQRELRYHEKMLEIEEEERVGQ